MSLLWYLAVNVAGFDIRDRPDCAIKGACQVYKQHCKTHQHPCFRYTKTQTVTPANSSLDAQNLNPCYSKTHAVIPAQLSVDTSKHTFALNLLYGQLEHGSMEHTWLTWLSRGHLTRGPHDGRGLHLRPGKHHAWGRPPHSSCWPSQTLYKHYYPFTQHFEYNITKNSSMRSASEIQNASSLKT